MAHISCKLEKNAKQEKKQIRKKCKAGKEAKRKEYRKKIAEEKIEI